MQGVTTEQLHALLHTLDASQRQVLDAAFRKVRSRPVGVLYRRLLEMPEWDEVAEKKMRGRKFANSGFYWRVRQELADGIVDHLMPAESSLPALDGIRVAIHLDLLPIARERAVREAEGAFERGDRPYLNLLLTSLHELERTYHFRFDLPEHLPHWTEANVRADLRHQLLRILDHIRVAFKESEETRKFVGKGLADRLRETDWGDCEGSFELRKSWVGVYLLKDDIHAAIAAQEEIVEDMVAHPERYAVPVVCAEMTIFIRFTLYVGDKERSGRYALLLSRIEGGNRIENRLKEDLTISTQIVVAEFVALLEVAEKAEPILVELKELPSDLRAGLIIRLAMSFFYHGKIEKAYRWMKEFTNIPPRYCTNVNWEYSMFSAMIHFEKENYDLAETYVESARKKAEQMDTEYQKEATKALKTLIFGKEVDRKMPMILNRLEEILESQTEEKAAWLIDIRHYIEYKTENRPLFEIIQAANRVPFSIRILRERA